MAPTYTGEQPGAIRKFLGELLGIDKGVDRYEDVYGEGVPSYDIASGDARPIGRRAIRYGDAPVTEMPLDLEEDTPGAMEGILPPPPSEIPTKEQFEGPTDWYGNMTNGDANRIIEGAEVEPMHGTEIGDAGPMNLIESDITDVSGEAPVNKYPEGTLMHWLNSSTASDPNAVGGRMGAIQRQSAAKRGPEDFVESTGGRGQPPPLPASPDVVPPEPPAARPVNPRANVAGSAGGQDVSPGTGPDLKGRGGRGRPEPDITGAEVDPMNLMGGASLPPQGFDPNTVANTYGGELPIPPVNPRADVGGGVSTDADVGGAVRFRGQPSITQDLPSAVPGAAPEITPTPLPMNPPLGIRSRGVTPPSLSVNPRAAALNTSIAGGGEGAGGIGGRGQAGGNAAQQGAFNLMNVIRSMMPKSAPPPSLDRPPMEGPLTAAPEPDWIKNRSRGLLN